MSKLTWFVTIIILNFSISLCAQNALPDPAYKLIQGRNLVQSKNYYLLTLLEEDRELSKVLQSDTVLAGISKMKKEGLKLALKECNNNAGCMLGKMKFSEREIEQVGVRLSELYVS